MPQPLTAPMPAGLDIVSGFQIQVTALDPTTGAQVAGVTVSNIVIEAEAVGVGTVASGDFVPLPLLTPETP